MTDKPTLEGVLDWAGVAYRPGRVEQRCRCPLDAHARGDRNPSMSVNLTKQVWKCMSCGEGGDAWTLIELREKCSFERAIRVAATLALPTGDGGGGDRDLRESPYASSNYLSDESGNSPASDPYRPAWLRGD